MLNEMKSPSSGKKAKIIYWIFTSLFAFMMLGSAIPDVFSVKMAMDGFTKMDMPVYLLPFLGIAKVLGVIAILIPGYPRLKEWAYAGLVFDLLGATYSIIASGQHAANYAFMFLPLSFAFGSYYWYYKKQRTSVSVPIKDATAVNITTAVA